MYPRGYAMCMRYTIESTEQYDKWFGKLKDSVIKIRILARLSRVENGNFGDFKPLSANLFELRFFFGAGLRVYYAINNNSVVILIVGGDKSSQKQDIIKATELLAEMEEER